MWQSKLTLKFIDRSIAIDKLEGANAYFRRDIHLVLHAMRTDSRKDIVDL
jgi:hypothetical protein